MDIHSISEVNRPDIDLSSIEGPAHSTDFEEQQPTQGHG
jgi:NADH-quinone oxidoreductase subunit G